MASFRIPANIEDEARRAAVTRALDYMDLQANGKITDIGLDVVWIGSCTNGRIEDLRAAAAIVEGKKISERLDYAHIVPGSGLVKEQAEAEGLDKIFKNAGFRLARARLLDVFGHEPGPAEAGPALCAATSNQQLRRPAGLSRTDASWCHLQWQRQRLLPGHFVDVRTLS